MKTTADRIAARIESSRQYNIGNYPYFVWPYKGLQPIDPREIAYLLEELQRLVPSKVDALFSFMTDGDLLAAPLAQKMQLPLIVARDHHYHLPDRLSFTQRTGYFSRQLHTERPRRGQKLCLVDAIISKGGTMISATTAIRNAGSEVVAIIAAIAKVDEGGLAKIRDEVALEPRVIWKVGIKNNQLSIDKSRV